jgi:tetratricopeptide (TPR) repeat protein
LEIAEYMSPCKKYFRRLPHVLLVLTLVITCITIFRAQSAHARMKLNPYPDKEEMLSLPRWCQVCVVTNASIFSGDKSSVTDALMAERAQWAKKIGEDVFIYLHHYCAALNWINRYNKSMFDEDYPEASMHREAALRSGLQEFAFVRTHVNKAWILFPELLLKEAFIYRALENNIQAIKNLREALELRPDYAPIYQELAETYKKVGMKDQAAATLKLMLERTQNKK